MKIVIEEKDIQSVRESLNQLDLKASDDLIIDMINEECELKDSLILDGHVDYEDMAEILVSYLDIKIPWPCYSDTEEYTRVFFTKFAERAVKKGFTLDGDDATLWVESCCEN